MIIQGGFDFTQLAQPLIRRHGRNRSRLVLIQATRDLELHSVSVVTKHYSGTLAPYLEEIVGLLNPEQTKFFAVAHPDEVAPGGTPNERTMDESQILDARAAAEGFHLIGHVLFCSSSWLSLRGSLYFEQYGDRGIGLPSSMDRWERSPSIDEHT